MPQSHDRLLEGLRIIDAGQVLAGPFVSSLLADMGADVIRVEQPSLKANVAAHTNSGRAGEQRNKRSVTLDLHRPEAIPVMKKLVASADAIVENFSPGTVERWGMGPDDLNQANPRLIYVRISGFGQTGPYRDRTSYDRIGQAIGGLIYVTGEADQPPVHPGYMLGDYVSGTFGALAILAAVFHRDHAGCDEPQVVDLSLYESIFRYSGPMAAEYSREGIIRERRGNVRAWSIPGEQFLTRDGHWVLILALNPQIFQRLCDAMGLPDLPKDPKFCDHESRLANEAELHEMIRQWVKVQDRAALYAVLDQFRVPYGGVNSIADIFADPHFAAREDLVTIEDPHVGTVVTPAPYPRLSHAPGRVYNPAPTIGEHNDEVYCALLGMTAEEVESLTALGVI
ncbi:MAG: CaiB/BaiF CoA-transferase family protein [Dehalococcoidia bacterium]|jgi:crotonobetainyl-CoA:carnitine CoA-transferase CaiB-like acyl-CoA transferase